MNLQVQPEVSPSHRALAVAVSCLLRQEAVHASLPQRNEVGLGFKVWVQRNFLKSTPNFEITSEPLLLGAG